MQQSEPAAGGAAAAGRGGVTMMLWASAFIAIRAVGEHYSPGAMALGRLAGRRARAQRRAAASGPVTVPRGRPLLLVLAYGVLWFGVYAVLVNAAEHHLDAGTTALVVNVGPVLIAVLAGIYLREGFPRGLVTGLVDRVRRRRHDRRRHLHRPARRDRRPARARRRGAVRGRRAAAEAGAARRRPVHRDVAGLRRRARRSCLPFAPALVAEVGAAPAAATAGVVYLGLFPTAIAFATWSYALARTSAGSWAPRRTWCRALAVLMSWAAAGRGADPLALAGGALCLVGVALTRLPGRPRAAGSGAEAAAIDRSWAIWSARDSLTRRARSLVSGLRAVRGLQVALSTALCWWAMIRFRNVRSNSAPSPRAARPPPPARRPAGRRGRRVRSGRGPQRWAWTSLSATPVDLASSPWVASTPGEVRTSSRLARSAATRPAPSPCPMWTIIIWRNITSVPLCAAWPAAARRRRSPRPPRPRRRPRPRGAADPHPRAATGQQRHHRDAATRGLIRPAARAPA